MQAVLLCCVLWLAACSRPAAEHVEAAPVKAFLNTYFSTWSAQDMDGYAACFHPNARVTFIDNAGQGRSQGLTDFIHGQKLSHSQSATPMKEVPTDMKLTGDARIAQAQVRWKLTKGSETVTGTDFFTLVKTASGWRIMALVFYND
jgi:hypothetical protein